MKKEYIKAIKVLNHYFDSYDDFINCINDNKDCVIYLLKDLCYVEYRGNQIIQCLCRKSAKILLDGIMKGDFDD